MDSKQRRPLREISADALVMRILRRNPRSPKLILIVALPAAGKTGLARAFQKRGCTRLNLDTTREEMYGDEATQGNAREVNELFHKRVGEALARGESLVIDNTNFRYSMRKPVLELAAAAGVTDVQLLVLKVPLEECLRRNRLRERVVPEDIILGMHQHLKGRGFPRKSEGWITILRPGKDENHFQL